MKEDYSQLVEYLDSKFEKINEKIEGKLDREEFLTSQDDVLIKLNLLLDDKTIGDEQDKRKTRVLEIHNNALKSKAILSSQQTLEIDKLQAF